MLLTKSKLNEQNRRCERKTYEKQIEENNKRINDLTQTTEMLRTPN